MGRVFNFGWSFSKDTLFRECERAFFFHYAHKEEPFEYKALSLKELKTPLMMAGTVVDTIIGKALLALKDGGEVHTGLSPRGLKAFDYIWNKSAVFGPKSFNSEEIPDQAIVLGHHYFSEPDSEEEKVAAADTVRICLDNFETSDLWRVLQSKASLEWGEIRTHGDGKFPPTFRLGKNMRFWAAYDFFIKEPPELHILDWKSGKKNPRSEQKAKQQLAIYSLYGENRLKTEARNVTVQAIWLSEKPTWNPEQVDSRLTAAVEEEVLKNARLVLSKLKPDGDYRGNPVYVASSDDFPPNPFSRKCAQCRFLTICADGQAEVGKPLDQPTDAEPDVYFDEE